MTHGESPHSKSRSSRSSLGSRTPSSLAKRSAVRMDCCTRCTSSLRCCSNSTSNCCASGAGSGKMETEMKRCDFICLEPWDFWDFIGYRHFIVLKTTHTHIYIYISYNHMLIYNIIYIYNNIYIYILYNRYIYIYIYIYIRAQLIPKVWHPISAAIQVTRWTGELGPATSISLWPVQGVPPGHFCAHSSGLLR